MRRRILGSLIVLSMVVLPAVPTMAKGDQVQLIVFVKGPDGQPLSGVRVRLLPRKPPTATEVLAEATTDDNGNGKFTTAKGAGLPLAVIKKTGGVRIVVSLAGYKDETKAVSDDELSYSIEEPDVHYVSLQKLPPPARSLVLSQTVADFGKLSARGRHRVSPTGFSMEAKDTGEAYTFVLLQGPPAEIRSGQELVVSVEGKVERPSFDYGVRVCWELQPGPTIDCERAVKSGGLTIGLNSETNKVTPSGKADFRVQVPADLTGGRAALILSVGWALGIEPHYDEWVRFEYGPK